MKKGHLASDKPISVEITTHEVAQLVDSVIQAVDHSLMGPMIEYGGTPEKPVKVINQAAFTVFLQTFTTLLTKIDTVTLIPEKESESGLITELPNQN